MPRLKPRHAGQARRLVPMMLLEGMLVLALHPSPQAEPLDQSHGELAEHHSCEHHTHVGWPAVTAPQVYTRPTRSGQAGDIERDAARALRRGRGMQEQAESPRWQPIRIGVSYASVGANREHHCYEEGEVTKVGSPRPESPACTPPAADGSSVASDGYDTDCWYLCTAEDVLTPEKQALLEQQVAEVMAAFQSLLSIERVQGPLRVASSASCGRDGGVSFPQAYLDQGVSDTDLILMATARPTLGSTLAWAVACERDQWGRTVAGQVNVAPRYVKAGSLQLLRTVLQHEVIHVLGFDPNAFELYRDEANRLRGGVTQSGYDSALGASVTRVVTPRVEMYGRQHFGVADDIADFPGVELENNGGIGTVGSHWERRVMGTEMMTGTVKANAPLSRITLALLEDSGWYVVHNDSSLADNHFTWGFGEGQSFLTQPCDTRSEQYFCQVMREEGCVPDFSAIGYCANDSLALSCPTFNAYSNGDCSTGLPETRYGETRGPMAKCLASTLVLSSPQFSRSLATNSGCYDARCTTEGTVQVAVNNQWQACPPEGGLLLQWDGYDGDVECPVAAQLCALSNATLFRCPASCNFRGLCRGGACECFLGWGGDSCELQMCPNDCSGNGRCVTEQLGGQTCVCDAGFSGADCSARQCEENCYLAGGVCTPEGTCEVVCSNRAGYQCVDVTQLRDNGLDFCDGMYDDGASVCAPIGSGSVREMEQETIIVQYHQLVSEGPIPFALPDVAGIGPTKCKANAREMTCKLYLQPCGSDNRTALGVCESLCDATNANCWTKMDCAGTSFISDDDSSSASCSGAKASVSFHRSVEFVWVAIFIAISTVGCSILVLARRLLRGCWKPQPAAVDLPQGAPPLHHSMGMGPMEVNGYPAVPGMPMVLGGASHSQLQSTSHMQLPPSQGGFTTLDNAFDAPPPPTQMDNPLLRSPSRFSERWQ